jgi:hypothetical protein
LVIVKCSATDPAAPSLAKLAESCDTRQRETAPDWEEVEGRELETACDAPLESVTVTVLVTVRVGEDEAAEPPQPAASARQAAAGAKRPANEGWLRMFQA